MIHLPQYQPKLQDPIGSAKWRPVPMGKSRVPELLNSNADQVPADATIF